MACSVIWRPLVCTMDVFYLAGGGVGSGGTAHITVDEERDMLDVFAGVFTVLEPHYFRDVFQSSMRFMFGTYL